MMERFGLNFQESDKIKKNKLKIRKSPLRLDFKKKYCKSSLRLKSNERFLKSIRLNCKSLLMTVFDLNSQKSFKSPKLKKNLQGSFKALNIKTN
jgi:hypothetical protein